MKTRKQWEEKCLVSVFFQNKANGILQSGMLDLSILIQHVYYFIVARLEQQQ